MVFASSVSAQVVADPNSPGKLRPTVLETANGVVQVNIQTPSAAGVSRNVYSQFDVPKSGVILNNSRTDVQTQIGGWVQGNPWLGTGTAKVILNEVNSSNPSRLQGYIEVAGSRAETIIANPAGIAVEGGGFINVSRATLTTGSPIFEGGSLRGYSVQRGQIVIGGEGLDASKTDYTALIARSVQVNAGLWAQRLNVITGANEVEEAALASVTQASQATGAAPLFAVDVAQLGGMYANQIYMVGTEAGVGVRNAGGIGASAGDLVVTSSGRLENSGTLSADQRLQVGAASVANRGSIHAGDKLAMKAGGIANAGQVKAGTEVLLTMQGEIDNGGGRIEAPRIDLKGASLRNAQGAILQTGASALALEAEQVSNASGTLGRRSVAGTTETGGTADAGGGATSPSGAGGTGGAAPDGPGYTNTDAPGVSSPQPVLADGRVEVLSLDNASGLIASNGQMTLNTGTLENRSGVAYLSSLSVIGPSLDNTGGTLTILGAFNPRLESLVNDQGKLLIGGAFDAGFGSFSNRQGLLQATHLNVDVTRTLDNSGGTLRQLGSTTAGIRVGGELALGQGTLDIASSLGLRAGSISGSGSALNVTGNLDVEGGTTSSAQGKWIVGGYANLRTSGLDNNRGTIAAGGTLTVDSADFNNVGGTITAKDARITAGGALDNGGGTIQAGRSLEVSATGGIVNLAGSIAALASDSIMSLSGATLVNSGQIAGSGGVDLKAGSIVNMSDGKIAAGGPLTLNAHNSIDNTGTISSGAALTIDEAAAALTNRGTMVADGGIAIHAANIDNSGGTLATAARSGASVTLQANSLANRGGRIVAERALTLDVGGALDNDRGMLQGVDIVRTTAGENLTNDGGVIEATGAHAKLVLQADAILNGSGRVVNVGDGMTTIAAATSLESGGLVAGNGTLDLHTKNLVNRRGGTLASAGAMTAAIGTRFDNAGDVRSGAALDIAAQAAEVTNAGLVVAAGALTLSSAAFNNDGGQLATAKGSAGNLDLDVASISNRGGVILSDRSAQLISAGAFDSTHGKLQAAGSLELSVAGALSNNGGLIETLDPSARLNLQASALDNGSGRIVNVGAGATTVTVDGRFVSSGLVSGNGSVNLAASDLDNQDGARLAAGTNLNIGAGRTMVNAGQISSQEALRVSAASAAVRNSGHIVSGADASLDTASFDNSGGRVGTVAGSGGDIVLHASDIINERGKLLADGAAHITSGGMLDNSQGELRANTAMAIDAAGKLTNQDGVIETAGPGATLNVRTDSIENTAGRIVNVGSGATAVVGTSGIVNSGTIAGNGTLAISAQTLQSTSSGTIASLAALDLALRQELVNAGTITSAQTLHFNQGSASLTNSGRIGAGGAIEIDVAAVSNDGGHVYTVTSSGASINMRAGTVNNIGGTVSSDGRLQVEVAGSVANNGGTLHGGTGTILDVGSALTNGSGTIEAAAGTLGIRSQSVDSSGRIVNAGTGATTINTTTAIVNAGTIDGKGTLALSAETLQNSGSGTIRTGAALDLAIRQQLVNAGTMTSEGTVRFDQATGSVVNTGRLGAQGSIDIIAAEVSNNNGGQVYTANNSGAAITLDTGRLDNTGGTFSADGLLHVESGGSVANSAGLLRGGAGAALLANGVLENGSGAIEASSGVLAVQAQTINNSGRIENAGTGQTTIDSTDGIVNSGTIAGNGTLDVHASALRNEAGGKLASGRALVLDVDQQFRNAGTISSGGTLSFDETDASFANSGEISAAGSMHLTTASFDNGGGRISTVRGSGTDITVSSSTLRNGGGAILADRNVTLAVSGDVDNSLGKLQAGSNLVLTTSGTIRNAGGFVETMGAGSSLTLQGAAIHNGTGEISNAGSGDTRLLSQTSISNDGAIAGMGNVLLSGQTLLSQAGARIESGSDLTLAITRELGNQGKINSAGSLTFDQAGAIFANRGEVYSGGHTLINARLVNNDGGRLGTASGSGSDLTLTSQQLSNRDGRIASDRDLVVNTHVVDAIGELFAARDLVLTMDGDYVQSGGVQQLRSNRDLSLAVTGNITNTATMEAPRVLTLSGQHIVNGARASIEGADVILNARGDLNNAGEINGQNTLDISAANVSNSAGIVGGDVSLKAGSLNNSGSSALIGATGTLRLGVNSTLNNTGGATLYSSGDMTIGNQCCGSTDVVNNISSTIEAAGDLVLKAGSLNNVRENVEIVQVKTVDETVHMKMPSWYKFGENYARFDTEAANHRALEVYFVSPSDILEDQEYVTPDGYTIRRAVIRTHANDSAFHVAASGLYGYYGAQSRLTPAEGTRVIYYTERGQVANPDKGAPASNAIVRADSVKEWSSTVDFSNQYGNCSSDCIRLITEPDYVDPRTTIIRLTQRDLGPYKEKLEESRDAHHVVLEDQLAPGAGTVARILSGGDIRLTVSSAIENRFSDIKAKGSLIIDGGGTKNNTGATLYRTHSFDGRWKTVDGTITSYQRPSISEVLGSVAGVIEGNQGVSISGRNFSVVDVTAGTVGNIRNAVNVIGSGASGADAAGARVGASTGVGGTVGLAPVGVTGKTAELASGIAATGGNNVLGVSPNAAASGLGNTPRGGGKASASGYANKLVAATVGNTSGGAGSALAQQPGIGHGTAPGGVTQVAPSGLFIRNPDAKGSYLFETRPQFANRQQWASSDYLLKQLEFDPATTQKRLGDGFYEQRLVREQLAELTGHKAYSGASDDSIYSQLLTNAVSAAKEFGLRPGLALSAEQIKRLTSDIVWLENQTAMLPDGSTETVLVPKVYLAHVGTQALQPGGALVTGNGVVIQTTESIVNSGGVIDGGNGRTLLVAGQDIVNRGGRINGGVVALAADRDVKNESLAVTQRYDFQQNGGSYTTLANQATITATGALDIMAGRDLSDLAGKITAGSAVLTAGQNIGFGTIRTGSTYQSQIGDYTENNSSVTHQLSQINTAGDLKIAAKGDLKLAGTQVSIGTGGSGQLLAGKNINIAAVTNEVNTSAQNDPGSKQYDKRVNHNQTVVGTNVAATGRLTVAAGILEQGAINITASSMTAGEQLKLTATDSINIGSTQETHVSDTASTRTSGSALSRKTTQKADYVASSQAVGSALSGKTVDISAGKDINVLGSAIAGDGDVSLAALGNVNIGASTNTLTEQYHTQVKESGFLSRGGFGITYGTRVTTTDQSRDATTQSGQSRSMVGSIDGNLSVSAGNAVNIRGSNLSAGQDMILTGKSVAITPGADDVNGKLSTKMTQTGLTLAVGGSVVNAVQTAQGMSAAGAQTSSGRLKALAAATAVMTAKDTVDDLAKNGPSVKASLTMGRSESESTEVTTNRTHGGSVLAAGNNVIISATGGGKASNVDIVGSDVRAVGNVSLVADNQVNLLAAQDTESQHSQSKSRSASAGVAAEFSTSGGPKVGYTASVSASRGNVDGEGTTQVNSHVSAGNRLTIASGGDTNLMGAVASGNQVVATVGGNLNIESLQDTAKLDGKRQSISASGTIGAGGGFSASASNSRVTNDYASVQEQSGIRAGDGGFQVNVAGHTDLKGGVLSSSERAIGEARNSLTTETLSFSDIENRDSTKASGISLGMNVGKNQSGNTFSPSMAPGMGKVSHSQVSTTRSGISVATLMIGSKQAGEVVANLNRDVITGKDTAHALTKGWNGAQALGEVNAQMQITSAALPRMAKGIGDYAETRMKKLESQGNTEEAAKWAEGGIYRVAAHTALGTMGGGLGGAVGAAAAATAAPTIDELQKAMTVKLTDAGLGKNVAEVAAKLVAGGTAGVIGGVAGGSAGAVTGLNVDANNRQLHESESKKLAALKQGKSTDEQHRLDAAACALVRCADGVPTSDSQYRKLQALQSEGQSYNAEQMALKATGEFIYQAYLDPARDALTSRAELLRRTGGAINLGAGTLGTVGGGVVAAGGVATCVETLGLGCAVGAFGAYIATASNQQAQHGSQALFGPFQSSEGQRVLDSLNAQTFPGENDPLAAAGLDALKLGATALAGRMIPKGLAAADELAGGTKVVDKSIAADKLNRITYVEKGERPAPATYLSNRQIDAHLSNFEKGGSYLVPKDVLDTYGREKLGYPDNSQFIMTKGEMDGMLARAGGNIAVLEKELGIPAGAWQGKELVRIDVPSPRSLGLRLPSGNEAGANALWIPGGKLPTGQLEAVVDAIPKGKYIERKLWDPKK